MDQILLCSSCIPQATTISNTFINTYMLHANGSYVKVYLYLAMCIQSGATGLSISSLADNMENTEKDILRALLYWERKGLIQLQRQKNDAISGVTLLQINPSPDTYKDSSSDNRAASFPAQANTESGKTISARDAAIAPEVIPAQNTAPAPETISAQDAAPISETISARDTAPVSETVSAQDTAPVSETISARDTAPASETVSAQDTTPASETTSVQDTAPSSETVLAQDTALASKTASSESGRKTKPALTAANAVQEHTIQVSQEQSSRLAKNEEFVWICRIVENYLERPLNPAEVHLLIYLYDDLHFSEELILHLYEYCCSLQKTNVKYVQTVAFSWSDNGVTTPAQAQEMAANYSSTHSAIAKALALGRPLAGIEKRFVERWEKDWQMDLAVILEACNRTMLAIQKADFKYIEGILNNWHNSNVHTLQDIEACDANYKNQKKKEQKTGGRKSNNAPGKPNQFQTFQQRNTSSEEMDELEKMLLTKS